MITFDYESRSVLSVKDVGAYKYSQHPSTEVTCAAWLYDQEPDLNHWHSGTTGQGEWEPIEQSPDDVLDELARRIRDGEPIEAHNAFFEQMVWEFTWLRLLPWMPLPKPEQWHCSAAKAAALALPRKLETLAEVLQTSEQKDMVGHNIMKKLARPSKPTKANPGRRWWEDPKDIRRCWIYNGQDVRTERACSNQLRALSPSERRVWLLDQRMNRRGVHVDRTLIGAAMDMAASEVDSMNARLRELTGGEVPKGSSRPKLKKWVCARGVDLKDTKALTIERLLRDELMDAETEEALRIGLEVNRTSTRKYDAMAARMGDDDRIHDLMMYHGASTGRWSGTGVQPHNFVRGSIKSMDAACDTIMTLDPEWVRFMYGPVMDHLSQSARGALMAPEGREFIVADYAAVEARDVFWLAGDDAGLDAFRASDAKEGPEVYCLMAEQIFGHPVNKDDHPELRFVGKQTILGSGFGMGWEKYLDTCKRYGVVLEESVGRKAIDTYRKVHEPVASMWRSQEQAAMAAVRDRGIAVDCGRVRWAVRGRFLHCKLPSGRLLSYYKPWLASMFNVRVRVNKPERESALSFNESVVRGEAKAVERARRRASMICADNGWELMDVPPQVREQTVLRFWGVDSKTKKWRPQETYGGKLVENITQAVARDQLADAMVRMDDPALYEMLLSVHDETIAEVDEGRGDLREFELEMARPSTWCADAPLVAEGWRGKRYRKA